MPLETSAEGETDEANGAAWPLSPPELFSFPGPLLSAVSEDADRLPAPLPLVGVACEYFA
jgi:hypothetical protein